MIVDGIEAYDAKISLPRHLENQIVQNGMKQTLQEVCTILTEMKGGFKAFKMIGAFVAFVYGVTRLAQTALTIVEALHK